MKKVVLSIAAVAAAALALAGPAQAMGSGDSYLDMQTGVTYTVYEPTYTNGLPQTGFGNAIVGAGCQAEQPVLATYSKGKRAFTITEGNPICADIGQGPTVYTTTIMGAQATVQAYCMPGSRCAMKDVARYGGHLSVILPAANSLLRPTQVWVETMKGTSIGGNELVKIAQRLVAVASTRNDWQGNSNSNNQGWNGGGNNQGFDAGGNGGQGNQGWNGNSGNQGFSN